MASWLLCTRPYKRVSSANSLSVEHMPLRCFSRAAVYVNYRTDLTIVLTTQTSDAQSALKRYKECPFTLEKIERADVIPEL